MKVILTAISLFIAGICFGQTAQDYYQEAKNHYSNKDYETALKSINQAIAIDSSNARYLSTKAMCLLSTGRNKQAFTTYDKAILLNPDSIFLRIEKGQEQYFLNQSYQAIETFTDGLKIAKQDSDMVNLLNNRGSVFNSIRDFPAALTDLTKAYNLDSTNVVTINSLGILHGYMKQYDLAEKYLKKLLEIDPLNSLANMNLGFFYSKQGRFKESLTYFDKSIELTPGNPYPYNNRAYSKLKLGKVKSALKDVNKSIGIYASNSYSYRNRALIYIEMNKTKEACLDLQMAEKLGFTKQYGNEVKVLQNDYCN